MICSHYGQDLWIHSGFPSTSTNSPFWNMPQIPFFFTPSSFFISFRISSLRKNYNKNYNATLFKLCLGFPTITSKFRRWENGIPVLAKFALVARTDLNPSAAFMFIRTARRMWSVQVFFPLFCFCFFILFFFFFPSSSSFFIELLPSLTSSFNKRTQATIIINSTNMRYQNSVSSIRKRRHLHERGRREKRFAKRPRSNQPACLRLPGQPPCNPIRLLCRWW